jgi:Right handed beta helix region
MFYYKMMVILLLIYSCVTWNTGADRHFKKMRLPRAYYISPAGNDGNEGTLHAAFKTIQRLNELALHLGDSILFEGGHQYAGSLRIKLYSPGDQLYPVLISSYGKGNATIYSGNKTGIFIYKSQWLKIINLKISGSGRKKGNLYSGLALQNCNHINVDNITISGFQKSGLLIESCEDISVTNIFAFENGAAGISVEGPYGVKSSNHQIYIGKCRVENNPGDPTNFTNHSGNGIVVGNCSKVLIEYCTATNNGWDMPRKGNGPVGIWAYEADSVTIQHCLSYRNKTSVGAADGGGFDLDGGVTHSTIQYCLSYENQGAGYCIFQYLYASPWHDNVFRYNISVNDGTVSDAAAGLYIWNSSRDSNQFYNSYVYNNTIYNSTVSAISFSELSARKAFAFYNNIFVGKDNLLKGEMGTDTFLGNDWWRTGTQNDGDLIIGETKVLNENPDFENPGKINLTTASGLKNFGSFKISRASPLRNNGIDLNRILGINTGGIDFNSGKAPSAGIGASF